MISLAWNGTKKTLKNISFFFSRFISDNKNRFYTNDLPAEGTSNPAYILKASISKYLDFSFLRFLDV